MPDNSTIASRRLLRHTASVPKGFLRYYALRLLNEKDMSGSEIMNEVEKQTGGRWRPSPGSVYPLLAWFQDNSYTKEVPTEESGMRRYTLTEKGKGFYKEQLKLKEKLDEKLEFFAPPFLSGFWSGPAPEVFESIRRCVKSLFDLRMTVDEESRDQVLKEVSDILNGAAEKLEKISVRLKERKKMKGR